MDPVGANVDVVGSQISAEAMALDEYWYGPPYPPITRTRPSRSRVVVGLTRGTVGGSIETKPATGSQMSARARAMPMPCHSPETIIVRPSASSAARASPSPCLRRPYGPKRSSRRLRIRPGAADQQRTRDQGEEHHDHRERQRQARPPGPDVGGAAHGASGRGRPCQTRRVHVPRVATAGRPGRTPRHRRAVARSPTRRRHRIARS